MNRDDLYRALAGLGDEYVAERHPDDRLARCLVRLHTLATDMPSDVAQHMQNLSDQVLDRRVAARAGEPAALRTPAGWDSVDGLARLDDRAIAFEVAAELRSLDRLLFESKDWGLSGGDPNVDYLVPGLGRYLLPFPPLPVNKETFTRSSLRHHRILPTETDGLPVTLYQGPLVGEGVDGLNALAGALFEGHWLDPVISTETGTFHVERVEGVGQQAQVDEHFDALVQGERQFAVVWPELMCPPHIRERIVERLQRWPLTRNARRPVLVVVGSWHESDGAHRINRSPILDGSANERLNYDKRKLYTYKGAPEGIRSGRELPVMIVGRRLVGFAICLDFCDGAHRQAYTRLHLDLVIVPSYGAESTISEHRTAAKDIYLWHGSRSFVVQQGEPATREAAGYVLPAADGGTGDAVGSGVRFRKI